MTEQNRRWFRASPIGAAAVASRERTAQYLMTKRLEQLREQAA
ncbi:hypothetical protein ACWGDX_01040 [Streptomyces sp. NPDC055025]